MTINNISYIYIYTYQANRRTDLDHPLKKNFTPPPNPEKKLDF